MFHRLYQNYVVLAFNNACLGRLGLEFMMSGYSFLKAEGISVPMNVS